MFWQTSSFVACFYVLITSTQDLKAAARNESMAALRRAAGLEEIPAATHRVATIASSPSEPVRQPTITVSGKLATDSMIPQDGIDSVGGSSNIANPVDNHPPEHEDGGHAGVDRANPTASRPTEAAKDGPSVGGASDGISGLATQLLRAKPDDSKSRVGKAAAVVSTVAGRGRREEARRRAELYEVRPLSKQLWCNPGAYAVVLGLA